MQWISAYATIIRDGREVGALSVFLMGLGVLLLALGSCTGFYSIPIGFVALVACWVVAITLRVFYFGGNRDEHRYRYS
ncbi:MAG: hypothetical protein JW753_05420 [Dehalococcoidia bacterium]|nr:hypothetical protein [Dehalococcoidia bacterium]